MKKFIIALFILVFVVGSTVAFAKNIETPWDNPEIKIHVFEDFSSYGNKDVDQFSEGFVLESDAMTHFMRIKNEQFEFYAGGSSNMYFNYKLTAATASKSQFANATGFAFYVENNTPGDIILGLQSKNEDGIQYICTGETYFYDLDSQELYLADTDDTWDVHCMPIIPALFKGYVIFPMSSISKRADNSWSDWDSADYIDSLGLIVRGGVLTESENMIIDNLFIFGDVSDNNNNRVYLNGMPEPTPTVSATNTDNSTAAPTITDTATTQPTPNNSGLTWVYIAMGAVVVIGVIAIVLILGKKKT